MCNKNREKPEKPFSLKRICKTKWRMVQKHTKKISNEMDDLLVVRSLKLRLVHQYKNSLTG
jgi:hypothetical protein